MESLLWIVNCYLQHYIFAALSALGLEGRYETYKYVCITYEENHEGGWQIVRDRVGTEVGSGEVDGGGR